MHTCKADNSLFVGLLSICPVIGEKDNSCPKFLIVATFTFLQMLIIPAERAQKLYYKTSTFKGGSLVEWMVLVITGSTPGANTS